MAKPVFELAVVDGRPTVRGECDLVNAPRVEAWLASFDGQEATIDMSGVTFFDSSALRAFLNARRKNPNIRVVDPSPAVRKVLEITGMVEYLIDGRELSD
jgi:anti-anti-sigma factor